MSPADIARLARERCIAIVETDFGGPAHQVLECLSCRTIWRIYRNRSGTWPVRWWVCPNHQNHPLKGGDISKPSAAA